MAVSVAMVVARVVARAVMVMGGGGSGGSGGIAFLLFAKGFLSFAPVVPF